MPAYEQFEAVNGPWRTVVAVKLHKIRQALEANDSRTGSYVFVVFREYVETLVSKIDELLPAYASSKTRDAAKSRQNLLKGLDELAIYLRFYETALASSVPPALRDHALRVFNSIEATDLILLRPQNKQTFDTHLQDSSLREIIKKLALLTLRDPNTGEDAPGLVATLAYFDKLPNIFPISYPKYLGDFLPLYPALGHEFGHVLIENPQRDMKWRRDVHRRSAVIARKYGARSAPIRRLIRRWSLEFFCDLCAWQIYGEPFIYALWLMLLDQPSFGVMQFGRYAASDIGEDPVATTDTSHQEEKFLFVSYPLPVARIAHLVLKHNDTGGFRPAVPNARKFERWRKRFKGAFAVPFDSAYDEPEYRELVTEAAAIAENAFVDVLPYLQRLENESSHQVLSQLVELSQAWIPPTQVLQGKAFAPARWFETLFAVWIQFIEAGASRSPRVRGDNWPGDWIQFFYQAFDMSQIYETFEEARIGVEHGRAPR